jgi:hypothetical protein
VGPPRGENASGYNVRQSFELGYRWNTVGGNPDMYRSTVNYGNGIRLLGSSFSVQSLEGHGRWFDQILLNTQGLGNDPYQNAVLRIEKNRLYRYDFTWRSNAYVNPGLINLGITNPALRHRMDTVRHVQDQDFILFPQSRFRLFAGYSRNTQRGPGLTTLNLTDTRGDEFPLFADIRRQQNEYRAGFELAMFGVRLNLLHGWVNFKEDTPVSLTGPSAGANPEDLSTLTSLNRAEPYHGNSPYWRIALFREGRKYWSVNGRFTYVSGRRGFVQDESSLGADRLGAQTKRQVLTLGNAQRPAIAGNLTLSLFPAQRITFTNHTSMSHIRMVGNSYLIVYQNDTASSPVLPYDFLGIRTIANSTTLDARPARWFGVYGGFQYSTRRIRSMQFFEVPGQPVPLILRTPIEQTNQLRAGVFGIRLKPVRALTINLDSEIGRADHPIYPISDRNYQALRARAEYRFRNFRLSANARTDYNTNSVTLANFASRTRHYGADATWTGRDWFSIDASYSRQHLDTLGALQYFSFVDTRNQLISGERSYYVSNIHAATLAARFTIRLRADISIGYSHVQDVGDKRRTPTAGPSFSALPVFLAAQTFPLRFASPMGRVSIRITDDIRWNAGYQYYGYTEDFSMVYGYRAHTGYSSISWSF